MALKVSKVDVWMTTIEDRRGGLGEKVGPLADAIRNSPGMGSGGRCSARSCCSAC